MEVTYESICKKLGFTLENPKYKVSDYENDDEMEYVGEYLEKHNNMK